MTEQTDSPSNSDLTRYLAGRDLPCPGCGYNLRGLLTASCPECAQLLELRVNLAEPRVGMLVAAAAGLLTGAGSAFFLVFFVFLLMVNGKRAPRGDEFILLVVFPIITVFVEGVLATQLLRTGGRQWFRSLTDHGRRASVLGCWALSFVIGIAWFSLLRLM